MALDESEDRRFPLRTRPAPAPPFQASPPQWTARLAAFGRLPFVAGYEISLVKFNVLAKRHKRFFLAMPARIVAPHCLHHVFAQVQFERNARHRNVEIEQIQQRWAWTRQRARR